MKVIDFKRKNAVVGNMTITTNKNEASIYFYGDIMDSDWGYEDDQYPTKVRDALAEIDENATLNIRVNSGGGSVFGGYAIYNMLKNHKGKKITYIDGLAASIASIIALAGDEIIMPSNAMMMIHKPSTFMIGSYNADELAKEITMLDKVEESLLTVYADNLAENANIEHIKELVDAETWLTASEASELFNITIAEENKAAASTSKLFDSYKNLPERFKNATISDGKNTKSFNIEDYKEVINEYVDKYMANKEEEKAQEEEKRKTDILEFLEMVKREIGEENG